MQTPSVMVYTGFPSPHTSSHLPKTQQAVGTYGNVPECLPATRRPHVSPGRTTDHFHYLNTVFFAFKTCPLGSDPQASPSQQRWWARVCFELSRHREQGSLSLEPLSARCAAWVSALLFRLGLHATGMYPACSLRWGPAGHKSEQTPDPSREVTDLE